MDIAEIIENDNISFLALLMASDDSDSAHTSPHSSLSPPFSPFPHNLKPETESFFLPQSPPLSDIEEDDYSLGSILKECKRKAEKRKVLQTKAADKRRRDLIRGKMTELSQLLPGREGKRRRNMAELLEDTCTYVKFLEAQVRVLESMTVSRGCRGGGRLVRGAVNGLMN